MHCTFHHKDNDNSKISGKCPSGCQCEDTTHHYITCTKQPGIKSLHKELTPLTKHMDCKDTQEDIKEIILHSVKATLTGDQPTLDWHHDDTPLLNLISEAYEEDQCTISWHQFLLGRLSNKWRMAQAQWLLQQEQTTGEATKASKSATQWTQYTI